MIDIKQEVKIYEVDGEEVTECNRHSKLKVNSHWNRRNMVVLMFRGKSITILRRDLEVALENATNTNR